MDISYDNQLIEIAAGKFFTFQAYEVYAVYEQCVSLEIDLDFFLDNIVWNVVLDAYDDKICDKGDLILFFPALLGWYFASFHFNGKP